MCVCVWGGGGGVRGGGLNDHPSDILYGFTRVAVRLGWGGVYRSSDVRVTG